MNRVCIAGGPRTGKTTLATNIARQLGCEPKHTDDLVENHDWSECSRIIAEEWFAETGPWLVEGVAVPRALRKWLKANPTGKPCDQLVWKPHAWAALTKGQASMTKGCLAVMQEIETELRARGVEITTW